MGTQTFIHIYPTLVYAITRKYHNGICVQNMKKDFNHKTNEL